MEKTVEEAVDEMAQGVKKFLTEYSDTSLESITFVVYGDVAVQKLLQAALSLNF